MMPRFPGLSRVTSFVGLPFTAYDGAPVYLGHGPDSEPRIPYNEPLLPPPKVYPNPQGPTPDSSVSPNVQGASTPDLIVLPGQAATGGGLSIGALALIAVLLVGGWFIYKKVRGA